MKRNTVILCLVLTVVLTVPDGPSAMAAPSRLQVGVELVAEGFTSPVDLVAVPDGSGRLFVVDQVGTIWGLTVAGQRLDRPFLDIRDRMVPLSASYDERGLLGLAFHPQFKDNGRFFVYYSAPLRAGAPKGWNHTSHLSEFHVSGSSPEEADPGSERIVMQIDEPQANHNGGKIIFGPDGYLYIGLGDGGGANDTGLGHSPMGNGQDTSALLGKILRIDVDGQQPYGVPEDNPFVGKGGREEVFAYGFRNPWRMSFDTAGDHQLLVGDVGQNLWEEVDIVVAGGNYGWNLREGTHCFDPADPNTSPNQCPDTGASGEPLHAPILDYDHGRGTSITGGYVYRGSRLSDLTGQYIFGDWTGYWAEDTTRLLAATPSSTADGGQWTVTEITLVLPGGGNAGRFLLSFGQDATGELYVLTSESSGPTGSTGRVYRLVPAQ
jgi:glucose/arabinose dehydrogenase